MILDGITERVSKQLEEFSLWELLHNQAAMCRLGEKFAVTQLMRSQLFDTLAYMCETEIINRSIPFRRDPAEWPAVYDMSTWELVDKADFFRRKAIWAGNQTRYVVNQKPYLMIYKKLVNEISRRVQ